MRILPVVLMLPLVLACAGGLGGPQVIRIDYSHVDGESCMSGGGKPSLAFREAWDLSSCPSRGEDTSGMSNACRASYNAECCTQVGGGILGWEVHQVGGEKLVSPLCKI